MGFMLFRLTFLAGLLATGPGIAAGLLPYEDAEAVALGEGLYAEYCASCHGAELEGEGDWRVMKDNGMRPAPPHDETGHTWHHDDAKLIELTALGLEAVVGNGYKSEMIGFGDVLSETEILAVLAFIKSTWPDQIIDHHNQINAAN